MHDTTDFTAGMGFPRGRPDKGTSAQALVDRADGTPLDDLRLALELADPRDFVYELRRRGGSSSGTVSGDLYRRAWALDRDLRRVESVRRITQAFATSQRRSRSSPDAKRLARPDPSASATVTRERRDGLRGPRLSENRRPTRSRGTSTGAGDNRKRRGSRGQSGLTRAAVVDLVACRACGAGAGDRCIGRRTVPRPSTHLERRRDALAYARMR